VTGYFSSGDYSELADQLEQAAAWFKRLGIDILPTRIGNYRRVLYDLVRARESGNEEELRRLSADFLNSIYEAIEIGTIHAAFTDGSHDLYISNRVKTIAGGPISYAHEDASGGNRARNLAFELIIAGRLVRGGLPLTNVGQTDVAVRIGARTVLLECKRPYQETGLARCIKIASSQLDSRYKHAIGSRYAGVIAIDATRASNPAFGLLRGVPQAEVGVMLHRHLSQIWTAHREQFERNRHRKTIGAILRISAMAQLSGNSYPTYCQEYALAMADGIGELAKQQMQAIGNAFLAGSLLESAHRRG
jgi:hypothetical protein